MRFLLWNGVKVSLIPELKRGAEYMKKTWIAAIPILMLMTGCTSSHTGVTPKPASKVSNLSNIKTNTTVETSKAGDSWAGHVVINVGTYNTAEQEVEYPVISGLPNETVQNMINAILKRDSIYVPGKNGSPAGNYKYTCTFNVLYQQGDILNFMISSYIMPSGAAHGMPNEQSVIVNVKTGDSYTWKDIFNSSSDYLSQVSKIIENEDTKKELDTFEPFTGVRMEDQFYLTQNGITIYFTPYEWASYAQGFLYYPVSYSLVSNIVNKHGAFWNALQDTSGFQPLTGDITKDESIIQSLGYIPQSNLTGFMNGVAEVNLGNGQNLIAIAGMDSKNQDAQKVFFFLNTRYLGTDTAKAHGYITNVSPNGKSTISVDYENPSYSGFFEINYTWNGSKLNPDRGFPKNYEWY